MQRCPCAYDDKYAVHQVIYFTIYDSVSFGNMLRLKRYGERVVEKPQDPQYSKNHAEVEKLIK